MHLKIYIYSQNLTSELLLPIALHLGHQFFFGKHFTFSNWNLQEQGEGDHE